MNDDVGHTLNYIPIAFVILNRETSLFSFVNKKAQELLEIDDQEINEFDFSKVFADKVDLLDLLVNVEVHNQVKDVELCMKKSKTKEIIWVKAAAERGFYKGKDSTFITLFDFTAHKSLELQLKESRKKAETASIAKSAFLANMSHEIRTPMNSIIGFSEILAKRLKESRNLDYINSVVKSGRALLDLINEVLDYSKIEAGKFKLNNNSTNLFRIINEVYELFFYDAEIKGLKLSCNYPQNLPVFFNIDETRLKQVLINLISNSIKFTHKGTVKLNVELHKVDNTNYVATFIVEDTGIGIDKKQQESIFEAFAQHEFHDNKKYGGSGLGLTIAGNLVKLMGGELRLESEKQKGSTFKFTIPISKGSEATEKQIVEHISKEACETIVFNNSSILVIVDNIELRAIILEYLKDRSLQLIEVQNSEEGLRLARQEKPDMILMDDQLKSIDCFEMLTTLKQQEELKNTKITALIDSSTHYMMHEFNAVQFDSYIEKPIQEEDLINVLAKFISYRYTAENVLSDNIFGDLKDDKNAQEIIITSCREAFENYKRKKSNSNIKSLAQTLINSGETQQVNQVKELGVMLENAQKVYDLEQIDKITDLISSLIRS